MLNRIEVRNKRGFSDPVGNRLRKDMEEDLGIHVDEVRTVRCFTTNVEVHESTLETLAQELFCDPVVEEYSLKTPLAADFDWLIEVGFKPGVTDNVGRSSREGIRDLTGHKLEDGEDVWTSVQYLIWGELSAEQSEKICTGLLANPLIQRYEILSRSNWESGKRIVLADLNIRDSHQPSTNTIELPDSDEKLMEISDRMVLSLSLEEMRAVRHHFAKEANREDRERDGLPAKEPTDVELEVLAQTWSEHCKHKIFAADIDYTDAEGKTSKISNLYKTYIRDTTKEIAKRVSWLKSVFTDNAGVISFNKDWMVSIKVETHNSPSALDPFGGAMTGIVGVNRDIIGTGIGCRPIFNTDVFCFADPNYDKALPGILQHPRQIFKGVHLGVRDGGNESGIPTVNGSIVFDERFLGKPLVFCGTGGLVPAKLDAYERESHLKEIFPGDRVIMSGGRVGKDGIHGATFSSAALTETSPVSAVQIGDPITQKKMLDFLMEARDLGLYRFITDNGAGGLSSSVGEMATECGGVDLDLTNVPLKYAGLDPWEILISEAQERMSLAVPPEKSEELFRLAELRGVELTDIGAFADNAYFRVSHRGKVVCLLPMDFMHNGVPPLQLKAVFSPPTYDEPSEIPEDLNALSLRVLERLNVCSKESWVRQYDHEVQGMSVVKPFTGKKNDGPSDAAVIRPLYDSDEGLVVAHGILPRYSDIDTWHMTTGVVDEAVRSVIAVGGHLGDIAGLDNFCWPDPVQSPETPDGEHKLAQLVRSNQALREICLAYDLPCISGKDSMKNDYGRGENKISIPPTLLFTVIAKVEDVRKSVTMDAKSPRDLIYILGKTRAELGGSEFFAELGFVGNAVPQVRTDESIPLYKAISAATEKCLLRSCHDLSDGGLLAGLSETAMAGRLGMDIDLENLDEELQDFEKLFSESHSRFVVSVSPENQADFEKLLTGNSFSLLGTVKEEPLFTIRSNKGTIVEQKIEDLFAAWYRTVNWS